MHPASNDLPDAAKPFGRHPERFLSPLAQAVAVFEMSVQHLLGAGTVCKMTMQHLRGLFTVCKMTMQHLHSPFTVCEMTMQHLHSLFGVSEMIMQPLRSLFGVSEMIIQPLHTLFGVYGWGDVPVAAGCRMPFSKNDGGDARHHRVSEAVSHSSRPRRR